MDRRQLLNATLSVGAAALVSAPLYGQSESRPFGDSVPAFRAARRLVSTAFGRIAYVDEGSGPAALFLHGFPLNSYQWRGAIDRLRSRRRCIAADFLGLGYTEVVQGQSLAPAAQAAMLVALLDRLGVGTVDLVASDSGGAVAQLFLAANPTRVRSLLLTNCDTEPDCPPPALAPVIELAQRGLYAEQWLKPWLADKALARSPQGLGGLCYTRPGELADETIEDYLAPLVATPAREALTNGYAVALERNALAGLEAVLRRCDIPVSIVWGEADPIFSLKSPAYLDGLFPRSRGVLRIPEGKLFFPEEYPDLIAREAAALWSQAPA